MCCHNHCCPNLPDDTPPSSDNDKKKEKKPDPSGEPPKAPASEDNPKKSAPEESKAPADAKAPAPEDGKANGKGSDAKAPPKNPTNQDIKEYGREPSEEVKARFPNFKMKQYGDDVYAQTANGNYTRIGSYNDKGVFIPDKHQTPENLKFKVADKKVSEQFPEAKQKELYQAPNGDVYERSADGTWKYLGHVDPKTRQRDDAGAPKEPNSPKETPKEQPKAPEAPKDPAPKEPPKDPAPKEPAPKEPPKDPAPKEPAPKEPPKDPAPKEPPKDPAPKDPAPKEPPKDPAPKEPAPKEPAPKDPAPKDPAPKEPAPKEPAPKEPPKPPETKEPEPPTQPSDEEIEKNGTEPGSDVTAMFPNLKEIKVYGDNVYARSGDGWVLIGSYKDGVFNPSKNQSGENLGFKHVEPDRTAFMDQFPEISNRQNVYVAPDGSVYEQLDDGTWKYLGHVTNDVRDDANAPK